MCLTASAAILPAWDLAASSEISYKTPAAAPHRVLMVRSRKSCNILFVMQHLFSGFRMNSIKAMSEGKPIMLVNANNPCTPAGANPVKILKLIPWAAPPKWFMRSWILSFKSLFAEMSSMMASFSLWRALTDFCPWIRPPILRPPPRAPAPAPAPARLMRSRGEAAPKVAMVRAPLTMVATQPRTKTKWHIFILLKVLKWKKLL